MPLDMGFTDEDASFNGYEDIRKEGDQGKSKCRDYIMVYVRGTAQPGNLVRLWRSHQRASTPQLDPTLGAISMN